MIRLTRLKGSELWLNPLLVESVEATPDSVVTMANGHKYIVVEDTQTIAALFISFYREIGLARAMQGSWGEPG
ncbi:flagellar FlbD family protein [Alicyclobacillus acidiphilus]|uniref:flagellar FlbD family protein n=1 Tax=Alicyclobacillus acidiphilus TaxID=182455 RepID=UPI000835EA71|nr:flagellar FlbD family protein [Alicyclobacillus acidiphilus]